MSLPGRLCKPPPPPPPLEGTWHSTVIHFVKIWHVFLEGATNMHPLKLGAQVGNFRHKISNIQLEVQHSKSIFFTIAYMFCFNVVGRGQKQKRSDFISLWFTQYFCLIKKIVFAEWFSFFRPNLWLKSTKNRCIEPINWIKTITKG